MATIWINHSLGETNPPLTTMPTETVRRKVGLEVKSSRAVDITLRRRVNDSMGTEAIFFQFQFSEVSRSDSRKP